MTSTSISRCTPVHIEKFNIELMNKSILELNCKRLEGKIKENKKNKKNKKKTRRCRNSVE